MSSPYTTACNYDDGDCCRPDKNTNYCTNCTCLGQACQNKCSEVVCPGHNSSSTCMKNCFASTYNADGGICKPCHKNCIRCVGSGAGCCIECKYAKDGSFCVENCPNNKYKNNTNKECQPCHETCTLGKLFVNILKIVSSF